MPDVSAQPPIHLVIGTPCYGGNVTHYYMISALNLQQACAQRNIRLTFKLLGNDSLVTRARNLIVSQFLDDPTATHLMFIDADIGFSPDQVFALLDFNHEVAGGVYPMKTLNWPVIAAQARAEAPNLKSSALHYVVDFLDPKNITPSGSFVQVRHIGTGFLLIKRYVFERMAAEYPQLKFNGSDLGANSDLNSPNTYALFDCMIDPDNGAYLSEDYTFCRRWAAMGGEVWANMTSRLVHVGAMPFEGDLQSMLANFVG
ncbi:MAG TPA: hypothetical protein VK558_16845 [Patescibacteria group bacterium]|nr:hypothetical protein [Patescibacteria group bacterium]